MRSDRVIRLTTAEAPVTYHSLAAMPAIEDGAKTEIQLLKTGSFYDWRYGDFSVTPEDLAAIKANFDARSSAVPGDYDHSFSQGEGSRAAGWTQSLEIRADGHELWGTVELTPAAAQGVRDGEWRFISPEFSFAHIDEQGQNVGPCLLAWALTNRPFLEGMAEVTLAASRDGRVLARAGAAARNDTNPKEGTQMDLDKLRKALGLPDDASEAVILQTAAQQHALALNAPPSGAIVLSKEEHDALKAQAEEGTKAAEALRLSTRDQALATAVREGKLAPVALDAFKAMWDADPDAAAKALAALPVVEQFKREAAGEMLDAPGADDPDANVYERIETRAQELMALTPTLSLSAAYEKADAEIRPRRVAQEA